MKLVRHLDCYLYDEKINCENKERKRNRIEYYDNFAV